MSWLPRTIVGRLTLWAALMFLVFVPALWVGFSAGAEQISRQVVDTQILEFAAQLRGYRASILARRGLQDAEAPTDGIPTFLAADADWVWQFGVDGEIEERSDLLELSNAVLPVSAAADAPIFVLTDIETEIGLLRVAGRTVLEVSGGETSGEQRVQYVVGLGAARYADRVADHAERLRQLVFVAVIPVSGAILGMLVFVILTLRRHFDHLGTAIERYEHTGAAEIEGHFPREIQQIVDRTNAILRQNQLLIERTRKYVSKIAHDINHPLAILKNALRGETDLTALKGQMDRQIQRMTGLIERYSSLARAIGPDGQASGACAVADVLADTVDGFSILYRRTPLALTQDCPAGLTAVIPRHDLETMISNLVSNAHKYAKSHAHVSASASVPGVGAGGGLLLVVEDDGPGIPAAERDAALNWGRRLDEAPPGTGFGLSIVCDIADLYGGTVALGSSESLGGLSVTVTLPVKAWQDGV